MNGDGLASWDHTMGAGSGVNTQHESIYHIYILHIYISLLVASCARGARTSSGTVRDLPGGRKTGKILPVAGRVGEERLSSFHGS